MDIDKAMIRGAIKELMVGALRDTDFDMICSDYVLNELFDLDNLPEVDEFEISDLVFEECRKYVDKIEEFLKTID